MRQRLTTRSLVTVAILLVTFLAFAPFTTAQDKITLKMWDDYHGEDRSPIVKAAIEQFEENHPNVEIERTVRPLKDITAMVIPALSAGRGPDIVLVNAGEQMMGPLVRGGYLVNLDPYAEQYGWTKKLLSPSLWNRPRYSSDGTIMGTGNLYGVAFDGQLVGVYYNKEMFNDLGLEVPQSIAEFEEVCEKIREAGIAPIAFSGLKDYRFFHLYAEVQASVMSHYIGADAAQDYLDDIVLNWNARRTFVNAANEEAAAMIQDWVKRDFFIEGFAGLAGSDDLALFIAGKTAMFIQGSWYSTKIAGSDIEAGLFPFPPYEEGEKLPPQVGGITTPVGISIYSDYPDLAAEFLNILLTSDTTAQMQKERSVLPARVPVSLEGIEEGTLYYDMLTTWNRINEAGNVAHFLDWTTPTMWDTLAKAGRKLMALKITPEELVKLLDADYREWQKNKPGAAK